MEFRCLEDVCVNVMFVSSGAPRAICPDETIEAVEGDDVHLQYHLQPQKNASATFDVKRADLDVDPNVVYFYRHGQGHPDAQMDQYRDRTNLTCLDLRRGHLILRISSVKLSDGGRYRLFVAQQKAGCNIHLTVGKHAEFNTVQLNLACFYSKLL